MLAGVAFLIGSSLMGAGIVNRLGTLRRLLNPAEQILWGLVTGWLLSTIAAYFVARIAGRLELWPLAALAVVIWIAAFLLLWQPVRNWARNSPSKNIWRREYAGLILVLVLFAPIYIKLFSTHMVQPGVDGVYSGGSTTYDLAFHLALTTSFLDGQNFPPIYTPFPPASLWYPFLPDFQISLQAALGMDLRTGLLATSIPLALAITGLFYFFARRIITTVFQTPSSTRFNAAFSLANIGGALATILFLLNGGLGFIYFYEDWRRSGKSLSAFWSQLDINYANLAERNTQWANIIVDFLLPQRSSLFGLSVALIVFTLFAIGWQDWSRDQNKEAPWCGAWVLIAAGVFTGLLPFFHAHTYVGIGLVSGFLFLLRPRRQWLLFWTPAVLLALPYLLGVLGHVSGESFMRFQPGWRGEGEEVWSWYWLRNVGLPTLLIIPAWLAAPALWRNFYLPFLGLLVVSLTVVFSPNDFDNIKLIYLWYAPTSVLLAAWFVRLASIHKQRLLAGVLALGCIASGLLALKFESVNRTLMFSWEELAAANFARESTRPRSLFLTAPTVHQPILSMAGRSVLRADTAWLWSHGYEFAQREADVKSIYTGSDEALDLISYYGIDYIYFGPTERRAGASESFFAEKFPRVYHSTNIAIYEVNSERGNRQPPANVPPREFASRVDKDPYQLLVEFQRAGYAVYGFYKTAFGRRPLYEEFMKDLKIVGRDVYVAGEGWRDVLENNKKILSESWLARSDFKARYDGHSAEQYVDALLKNSGRTVSHDERASLTSEFNSNPKAKATVLRRIAGLVNSKYEYNEAYVLVHYFGYLRRDPDELGLNFWLSDLNRKGDYRSLSRVFIESMEYKEQKR